MAVFDEFQGSSNIAIVDVPRSRLEFDVLHATLLLALLIHAVGLFGYATLYGTRQEFFTEKDVLLQNQTTVDMVVIKPQPAPQAPLVVAPAAPQTQQKAPQQRVVVKAPPRQNPIPNPKPVQVAKGSQNPGPKQYAPRPAPVTNTAPRVVAANNAPGPAMNVGNGTGAVGGDPNSHGNGDGGKPGDPNGVPNGDPNGGGGRGGQPTRGEMTMSAPDWNNWQHLPESVRPPAEPSTEVRMRASGSRDWKALCDAWGMDYNKMSSLPHVDPYILGQGNPELGDSEKLNGRQGNVRIVADIDENGRIKAQVVPSGDALLDKIGYNIAASSRWLPAMAYGKPVASHIEFTIMFTTYYGGQR